MQTPPVRVKVKGEATHRGEAVPMKAAAQQELGATMPSPWASMLPSSAAAPEKTRSLSLRAERGQEARARSRWPRVVRGQPARARPLRSTSTPPLLREEPASLAVRAATPREGTRVRQRQTVQSMRLLGPGARPAQLAALAAEGQLEVAQEELVRRLD